MDDIEVIRLQYWWPESTERLRQEGGGIPIAWRSSKLARLQMIPFALIHTLSVAYYARDCDIIHAHWTLSAGAARLSRFIHRRPIVATLHGSDIFQGARGKLGAWITHWILQGCDALITISQALMKATTQLGIPAEAIKVIPEPIDVERFNISSKLRMPLILYVGSLIERKGVIYLIEALSRLASIHPSLQLVVIGKGPERERLENVVADSALTKRVAFIGSQPSDTVRKWMQRAKIFVLPSIEEGLGVVLIEALACGTPIVASDVGGIPDVVTPDVGLLVPPASSELLAKAIDQLLRDDQLHARMSKNSRQRAEKYFDSNQIATKLITIYREVTGLQTT